MRERGDICLLLGISKKRIIFLHAVDIHCKVYLKMVNDKQDRADPEGRRIVLQFFFFIVKRYSKFLPVSIYELMETIVVEKNIIECCKPLF